MILGEGLEEIGEGAFIVCTSQQEIIIPPLVRGQGDQDLAILLVLAADYCGSWRGAGGDWGAAICRMHIAE